MQGHGSQLVNGTQKVNKVTAKLNYILFNIKCLVSGYTVYCLVSTTSKAAFDIHCSNVIRGQRFLEVLFL